MAGTLQYENENLIANNGYVYGEEGTVLKSVAGAVADSSFLVAPPDGTIAYDSTNNKLYVRDAGAWVATGALS